MYSKWRSSDEKSCSSLATLASITTANSVLVQVKGSLGIPQKEPKPDLQNLDTKVLGLEQDQVFIARLLDHC